MRIVRTLSFTALLLAGLAMVPQEASASSSVGFFLGFNRYHPGYYHHYRPFYRPFFYRPFFGGLYNPYYYGYGGYGGYGYGYGYPYSSYRGSFEGEIRTEVKPQEARVYVDGDYAGVADDFDGWWQRLEVRPGRHRLTFRAPGFAPYVVDVNVGPGRDAHIKYQLRPGQDRIAELEMRLPRDEYSRRDDYGRRDRYDRGDRYRRREFRRERDRYQDPYDDDRDDDRDYDRDYDKRDRDDRYRDKPYFGDDEDRRRSDRDSNRRTLTLLVEPSDATVYIDGNYYGTANDNGRGELQVLLPEGVHRVEVVRPGHSSFSQDVTISARGENRLSIKLQRK